MFCRRWFLAAAWLAALLRTGQAPVFGQENPITADQVIANYLVAIGGSDRIAGIATLAEKGELTGNLAGFGRPFVSPTMQKEHGTFEFYFKAPSFRFSVLHRDRDTVGVMQGCDGNVSWYIGADAVKHEFNPKPGSEYECKKGYEPLPLIARAPNLSFKLMGKKKIADRMAWVVRAQDPKSLSRETYYFDTETYLLLRWESGGLSNSPGRLSKVERLYSDYRDVGGIKLPFMVDQHSEYFSLVTILREVEINPPIDDARFQEPKILGGTGKPQVVLEGPSKGAEVHAEVPPADRPDKIEATPAVTAPETHAAAESASVVTTNFVSYSIAELQQAVPELRGLRAAEDQQALPALLGKIGDRTFDLSRKIPNLICHEEVVESQQGAKTKREDFSYLILARRGQEAVTLEEFRVDLKTGAKLETDDARKPGTSSEQDSSSRWEDLARASQRTNARATGAPLNQGFASMWLRFYPANRSESTFRYVGQQKMDGRQTLVVAYAQKPESVRLPGEVRFADKSIPIYYQGICLG